MNLYYVLCEICVLDIFIMRIELDNLTVCIFRAIRMNCHEIIYRYEPKISLRKQTACLTEVFNASKLRFIRNECRGMLIFKC
jgi:hypothetical protein